MEHLFYFVVNKFCYIIVLFWTHKDDVKLPWKLYRNQDKLTDEEFGHQDKSSKSFSQENLHVSFSKYNFIKKWDGTSYRIDRKKITTTRSI